MPYESTIYIICSSVSITISITIALLFWERRNAHGARSMSLILALAAQWTMCDLLSALSNSIIFKMFWNKMAYLGAILIPVLWLIFSLQYTKNEKYLTIRNLILISIVPSLTLIMLWTNNMHHLFETRVEFAKAGLMSIIVPYYGVWFWVHVSFSYTLILLGSILILRSLVNQPKVYRNQSIVMILAVSYPFLGSILYSFNVHPSYPVDPTMFSFSFSGVLFFFGMFRFKLFSLVPAARAVVIENMEESVIVLDDQNRIIDINLSALKLMNKNAKDLTGKSIYDILENIPQFFMKYLDSVSASDKVMLPIEGENRYFNFSISPLYDNKNKFIGRYVTLRDITTLEAALENSEKSRRSAEEASKAKSQFLATMSHEIRTPLNGIIGMGELLTSANLTSDEKNYLESVQASANSLLDIINDILDFSKIEAGRMELEKTSFNFKDLLDTSINMFQYKAAQKGLLLVSHISEDIPANLIGDPIRLRQILVNLIGNSLKFTDVGQVQVKAEKLSHEGSNVLLGITVEDTGIGISEDKIGYLFNSFEQLDNSTTRKYGGTGLGLAIVRDLIDMMGGSIEVNSTFGVGSSFILTIPFTISDHQKLVDNNTTPVNFTQKNINILLAEDNKVNQAFMVKLLEKMGFTAVIAENGKFVLEKFNHDNFHLILMDIQMPEMDGYEATLAIRSLEAASQKHIPIIALTANATEEDRIKCIQSGMDDYISKPVKSDKLYECIKKYIQE